jgi:hypothetical protein
MLFEGCLRLHIGRRDIGLRFRLQNEKNYFRTKQLFLQENERVQRFNIEHAI